MHTSRSTHHHASSCLPQRHCVMLLTVDASAITAVRQMVMRLCGEAMEFMRVAICADTRKAKVWLCISPAMAAPVMDLILRALPAAEFGRVKNQSLQ
jgi:hypothetical protein